MLPNSIYKNEYVPFIVTVLKVPGIPGSIVILEEFVPSKIQTVRLVNPEVELGLNYRMELQLSTQRSAFCLLGLVTPELRAHYTNEAMKQNG